MLRVTAISQNVAGDTQKQRLHTVDALRGFASLIVCWYHLAHGRPDFLDDGLVKSYGRYGWLGVDMFFVISGFVIPWALHQGGYAWRSFPVFLVKRVVRLDPPYFAAIALVLGLEYLWPIPWGIHGAVGDMSLVQLVLHVGYLNTFFGYRWIEPVFWTLAIEFQYYLLIGLVFPLVASQKASVRWASLAGLGLIGLAFPLCLTLPRDGFGSYVFDYLFLFLIGIVTFQLRIGVLATRWYFPVLAAMGACCWCTLGRPSTIVGLGTALTIGFIPIRGRIFSFFGSIAYSLYLVHTPVGMRVINLFAQFDGITGNGRVLGFVAAFGLSIAAAYLFFRLIERPAQRWSWAIRYRTPERAAAPVVTKASREPARA